MLEKGAGMFSYEAIIKGTLKQGTKK